MQVDGFEPGEQIYASHNSLVYRARRESDGQAVILKIKNKEYPTRDELNAFRKEFEITRQFSSPGIIKVYELQGRDNFPVLVIEDFGGMTLEQGLEVVRPDMPAKIQLMLRLVEILDEIHQQNIIHKDINAANIIWNVDENILKIIDFGIATELPRQITALLHPNILEGTLAYISPEQTGRMNRALDYRTDYYSLGVTFYKILTGELPFHSNDPMEYVHCHIARIPQAPHLQNPLIPMVLSEIIMKLLAKNAEERYQSLRGLTVDLERCAQGFRDSNHIKHFEIAQEDYSDVFQISQYLYGREAELETLMESFLRVSLGRTELMLVSGYSGIGKSALINEIQKPIVKHRGNFLSGKFGQLKKEVPYSAVLQAFQQLTKQILTESEDVIEYWREKLRNSLGPNGQVILNVIPNMELILGPQTILPELGPAEAQNQFKLVFRRFIQVFASEQHPLVLFLDDLQWADLASLNLMETFLTDKDTNYLQVIGAYRSNEVDAGHPLALSIDVLKKSGVIINEVSLENLELPHVNQLIAESLRCTSEEVAPLARLTLEKTSGNPFFVNEFLKNLHRHELLSYNQGWSWDMQNIRGLGVTENVVDLLAERITLLPETQREVLKPAACVGNSFSPADLEHLFEGRGLDIRAGLRGLEKEGLLFWTGDVYKFIHDRIQEAAYSLISEKERGDLHYRIGFHVLRKTGAQDLPEKVFFIVNQLNAGRELLKNSEERRALLELNQMAGRKARSSASFASALLYFQTGIALLESDPWREQYEITLALHLDGARAAYLSNQEQVMEDLLALVLEKSRSKLDAVEAYEIKIYNSILRNDSLQAIEWAREILPHLGVKLPGKVNDLHILLGLIKTKWALWGKRIESLVDQPAMEDPVKLAAVRILSSIVSPAYFSSVKLYPLLILNSVRITVKYGNVSDSAFAYGVYASILCGVLLDIDAGYKFGELSQAVQERFGGRESRARNSVIFQHFVRPWKEHLEKSAEHLTQAYKLGLESGDLEYASNAATCRTINYYVRGESLEYQERESDKLVQTIEKFAQGSSLVFALLFRQAALNLNQPEKQEALMEGQAYRESRMRAEQEAAQDDSALACYYSLKLHLQYLGGDYEAAFRDGLEAEKRVDSMLSTPMVPFLNFYGSLNRLALAAENPALKRKLLRKVKNNQRRLKKWVRFSPENQAHRYALVRGELAALAGKKLEAIEYYETAIRLGNQNRYKHEEALALERAGKYWLKEGAEVTGMSFLSRAYNTYRQWGAVLKVQELEEVYPGLRNTQTQQIENSVGIGRVSTTLNTTLGGGNSGQGRILDLSTVIKSSQTISGEIQFGKLLEKLMSIVLENAGARRGLLILEKKKQLYVEAEAKVEKSEVTTLQSIPLEKFGELPVTIINLVARTKENIVLEDTSDNNPFETDAYLSRVAPLSILCMPVQNQGKLSGILYLENDLALGAFTRDRLEVLRLLASQIAISIDNAMLYAHLEDEVQERTVQLETALDDVQALKDRQDGDYFLTARLLEPLNESSATDKRIQCDLIVNQFKRFNFKQWSSEIGGDVCSCHDVYLGGKSYTLFLSADAMGKSMQGASGALVLMTALQALLKKLKSSPIQDKHTPDSWLRSAYYELYGIFATFKGAMQVSLIMGLADGETKRLYYFSGEHPPPVLFRKKRASYFESRGHTHKLGDVVVDPPLVIETFELRPGDMVFLGSDGKDDLDMGIDANGNRLIADEPEVFLKCVLEADGELEAIKAALLKRGEFIDDFSLLRLLVQREGEI